MKNDYEVKFQVARLAEDSGYLLVISELDTIVDDLAERMQNAKTNEELLNVASEWRATRRIVKMLRTMPENYMSEISSMNTVP